MTEMPSSIRVGTHEYKIQLKRELIDGVAGRTRNMQTIIEIDKGQALSNLRDTVVHESLHAMIYQSGAVQTCDLDGAAEERLVVTLAPWILQWIQNNPELIAYLTEIDE